MKLVAKIFKAGEPNANGIVYTEEALLNAIKVFNKTIHIAVGGSYPPPVSIPITSALGDLDKLVYEDGYVVATVTPYKGKLNDVQQAILGCKNIKIVPTGNFYTETAFTEEGFLDNMAISNIVCTCDDLYFGDADPALYVVEVIDDE